MNYITKNQSGWKVELIQKLLGIEVSGNFDDATLKAVKSFQKDNGLQVDGVIGEKTFAKLSGLKDCKRWINNIILHCAATKAGKDFSAKDIDGWHRKQNGWKCIGYHYVIRLDGTIEEGRNINLTGAHCTAKNTGSIGICYIGGLDADGKPKDTRTPAQEESLVRLVQSLMILHCLKPMNVWCHNNFSDKPCPCFKIEDFRKEIM